MYSPAACCRRATRLIQYSWRASLARRHWAAVRIQSAWRSLHAQLHLRHGLHAACTIQVSMQSLPILSFWIQFCMQGLTHKSDYQKWAYAQIVPATCHISESYDVLLLPIYLSTGSAPIYDVCSPSISSTRSDVSRRYGASIASTGAVARYACTLAQQPPQGRHAAPLAAGSKQGSAEPPPPAWGSDQGSPAAAGSCQAAASSFLSHGHTQHVQPV